MSSPVANSLRKTTGEACGPEVKAPALPSRYEPTEIIWTGTPMAHKKAAEPLGSAVKHWRLVETGESRTPRPEEPIIRMYYKLVRRFVLGLFRYRRHDLERPSRFIFGRHYRRRAGRIPDLWRLASPLPGIAGSRRSRFRRLERIHVRQLLCAT